MSGETCDFNKSEDGRQHRKRSWLLLDLYKCKWNTWKYTETLKTDNLGENEPSGTITEKENKNLWLLFLEKETEIEKLDRIKTVNEKIIADMKLEIENLKNEKQFNQT